MILKLYRGLTTIGGPLIGAYLSGRRARGKEDRERFDERRGQPGRPRPPGELVWLHAASVGESVSMLPVIERLQARSGTTVLVTTGTVTSAELMAERLPPGAIHQYVPVDRLPWVRRFLDHWRPNLVLWAESEFWPNLLVETAFRGVPLVLLNGRISDRSYARWRRHPRLTRQLLACFVLCLAQTPGDADRLKVLGARHVACHGNLKFAAPPLPIDESELVALGARLGNRPRWLAVSTHSGEEALAGRIHRALAVAHPALLTVIIPRHPGRGPQIAAELADNGLRVARRAAGQQATDETDILLADTLGEVGLFIHLAPVVFVGKSLIGRGGQNPLEPARLGASVLFGPHMDNFDQIAQRMCDNGAAERVADEVSLTRALERRLADSRLMTESGNRARDFAMAEDGVLDAVLSDLEPWLSRRDNGHARA